ncbi:MAG: hypothetical protein MJD61_09060 [Proteobacteria bacterium]|nr:hypothetical protein [Pseudomonadota bacterium]
MPHLRRIHFASAGYPDARLDPLTLDLRDADARRASDSVLWLRNGGGKSSVLNLLFSCFRPSQAEFLGRHVEGQRRRLTDYVKATDLACVATEWEVGQPDLLGTQPLRVIGQALAWRGQQRSADASRLQRIFFSFVADDDLSFEHLPTPGLGEPVNTLEAFREWLRERQREQPAREVVVEDQQRRWERHLADLRIDSELFGYQLKMNRREGAADELFKFASARQFTDFVLELVLDPTQANAVSANVEGLRDKLARRPALAQERRFSVATREQLGPLREAIAAADTARAELARRDAEAGSLLGALKHASQAQTAIATERARDQSAAEEQAREASNRQRKHARWAEGLERRALELARGEAKAERDRCSAALREVEGRRARALACEPLRELRAAEHSMQETRERLAKNREQAEPERQRLCAAGDALHNALGAEDERLKGKHEHLRAKLDATEHALAQAQAMRDAALGQAARAKTRAEHLSQQLRQRDEERDALVRRGDITLREPPEAANRRWRAEQQELADDCEGHREAVTRARALEIEAQERLRVLAAQLAERKTQHRQVQEQLEQALMSRERIETLPAITELEECDRADVFAQGLARRLASASQAADEARLRLRVDDAEDARAEESLRERGLMPAALDVERIVTTLRKTGISAHSAWEYLADNLNDVAAKRALIARDPARFGGVFVLQQDFAAACQHPLGEHLRSAVVVSVASLDPPEGRARPDSSPQVDSGPDSGPDAATDERFTVGPEQAGGFDHGAAVHEREQLGRRRESRARQSDTALARAHALRDAAGEVERFTKQWSAARLVEAREAEHALREEVAILERQGGESQAQLESVRAMIQQSEQGLMTATERLRETEQRLERIASFIERWEQRVAALRSGLDAARAEAATAERDAQRCAEAIAGAGFERDALQRQLADNERLQAQIHAQQQEVGYTGAEEPEPGLADEALSELRERYQRRRQHFEEHHSDQRLLGELTQLEYRRKDAETRFARAATGLLREDIEHFDALVGEDLADHLAETQAALAHATHARAEAAVKLQAAEQTFAEALHRRRAAADLPKGPAPATARDAREQAAQQQERAQQAQEQSRTLEERVKSLAQERQAAEQAAERQHAMARRLEDACEPPHAPALPLPTTDAEVRMLVDTCIERHRAARLELAQAQERQRSRVEAVRQVPMRPEFADFESAWRQRFMEGPESLVANAERWDEGLKERIGALEDELATLEADRQTLTESLLGITEHAVRLLLELERASRMPAELGAWAGQPFVSVQLDAPRTDADKRARIEPLLDELVAGSQLPGGLELVQRAVDKYRGSKPLRVTLLKPESERRRQRVDIAAMVNFSGGERLTAAVLLYCTLVHLRARRRGRNQAMTGNILVLDNPIGTCSSVPLLELQRQVARLMDTQLIYTTGVDDLAALAQLPNVVRLRNVHQSARTGDHHVTVEGQVEGVRVARRASA